MTRLDDILNGDMPPREEDDDEHGSVRGCPAVPRHGSGDRPTDLLGTDDLLEEE